MTSFIKHGNKNVRLWECEMTKLVELVAKWVTKFMEDIDV